MRSLLRTANPSCVWIWLLGVTFYAFLSAATLSVRAQTDDPQDKTAEKKEGGAAVKNGARAPEKAAPAASPYVEMTIKDGLSRYKTVTIPKMLRGTEPMNAKLFEDFFVGWFFPRMTKVSNIDQLPALRDELQEFFDKAKNNPKSTESLNQLTFEMMYAMVIGARRAVTPGGGGGYVYRREDEAGKSRRYFTLEHREIPAGGVKVERRAGPRDFHPAVKYNAMLVIAHLNDKQARGRSPATPRLKTLRHLVKIAEFSSAPQSLRVAALIGVARHPNAPDIEETPKKFIANSMLKIVGEKSSSGNPDGRNWIRRQAIEILAELGIPGPQNDVVTAMAKVLADPSQPLALRTAAARALGQIKITAPMGDEANDLAKNMGSLVVDACHYEMQGGRSRDELFSWTRLASTLDAVNGALAGVEPLVSAEDQALANRVKQDISTITSSARRPGASNEEMRKALSPAVQSLEAFLKGNKSATPVGPGGPGPAAPPKIPDDFPI